ncbi:MAG TPA: GNAT family N-acetyltransferase [Aliidongia sp.]|uniref:GNAT family N-acetyltransferase n=1 Tax=Aliidongia sp. TaxID=1914230 RepID=UPI002DDCABF4|nr:GNAT family N-acetyltransferase [Aliidongia sp.]HEV2676687.1 GNAT family N-acetyltransferase [Aliidongia sp.]
MTDRTLPISAATIRPSREDDMAAIAAIYCHHVLTGTASFETEAPDVAEMAQRRADLLGRGMPHLVLEQDGLVRGYAYAGPYRPRAAYRDTVENSVYLAPDAIGLGFGRRLLTVLIEECTARGLRQMVAVVGDSANLPSIRLHERMGFRNVGTLAAVGYKHGRWLDTVLLQRTLGAGDAAPPIDRAE